MATIINNYPRSIRKTIVGFGDLFNNITVSRTNPDGSINQTFSVPVIFAPKEKYLTKLLGDPNLDKKIQIALPRMSFDLTGIQYDSTRKQITNLKNYSTTNNPNQIYSQYVPVPYNFDFELYIYVRNIEDGTEIVEKILPFFTPDYTIKINYNPNMGEAGIKELPILLKDVNFNIDFEGETDSTRVIIWTLSFVAKGFIFGPISQSSVIKEVIIDLLNYNEAGVSDVTLNLANTGFGSYTIGETVFQGYSLETSNASAVVKYYSNTTNQLIITDITGKFLSNTYINGSQSHANYIISDTAMPDNKFATIDVKVNPLTANINSNYTIETTITEY